MFERKVEVSGAGRRVVGGALLSLCAALASPVGAQKAPAGASITNTASLTYGPLNGRVTVSSNSVALTVDATIDVAIVAREATLAVNDQTSILAVAFVVTNQGNARETFALTATAGTALAVAADDDGDGEYDSAHDHTTSVTLDAGASRTVFAIVSDAATAAPDVAMTASATTASGTPGQVFVGAGVDGIDVVIGLTGGSATAFTTLQKGAALPTLVKSQSVVAPDGSARVMPGSIVAYQLAARFPGATRGAVIADDVPAGTVFVPGSITIDGRSQTDAPDEDLASFDGTAVRVALGDIGGAAVRNISFMTKIK